MNRSDYSSKWRGCQASDCSLTTCFNTCKCETTGHFYGDLWTISSSDCGDKKLIFVLFVVTKAWWFCRPNLTRAKNTTWFNISVVCRDVQCKHLFSIWFVHNQGIKQIELLTQGRHKVITDHHGETTVVQNFAANHSLFVEFDLRTNNLSLRVDKLEGLSFGKIEWLYIQYWLRLFSLDENWWADLQMDIAITKAMDSRASEGRKKQCVHTVCAVLRNLLFICINFLPSGCTCQPGSTISSHPLLFHFLSFSWSHKWPPT